MRAPAVTREGADLPARLNELCDAQPFQTGWHLRVVETGETWNRLGDVVVPSASTRKVAIMMAAFQAVHEGRLALDQPMTVEPRYQQNVYYGVCQFLEPGLVLRLKDAVTLMNIVSDNVCTGMLVDLLGLARVNAFCRTVGMWGTTLRVGHPPRLPRDHALDAVNTTTPNDLGLLLDLILKGATNEAEAARLSCSPALCRLAIDILTAQRLPGGLRLLLPPDTIVAHKTGVGQGWRNFHDVGIVHHAGRPLFILAAYTEHVPLELPDGTPGRAAALGLIARLSRACYDLLKG